MTARVVVMGGSKGGFAAAQSILRGLSAGYPLAIGIVLHRSPFDEGLASFLGSGVELDVADALDGDPVTEGRVAVAPAGYHLLVDGDCWSLSVDDPVSYARPSIDVLFESAADRFRRDVVGVILSGTGSDGAAGLTRIRALGGTVIVQDPATAEAPEMPRAALAATAVEHVVPLPEIPHLLAALAQGAPA